MAQAAFATTNGEKNSPAKPESTGEHKTKKTETRIDSNTMAEESTTGVPGGETQITDGGQYLSQEQDSSNLNSVCKFNFIFYFIYKMKYEGSEDAGNEYLNYEF